MSKENNRIYPVVGTAEMETIRSWMNKTNTDEKVFCEWQQIPDLPSLPLHRLANVISALKRKKQRLSDNG
ncbi:MAG: hypothetical protein DRQ62_16200 [Gammaproteobacteria bacterium]|nr:MAG: hypothetical protein DRQ62_16200 [Gammaproteobacteria bacterium]